MVTVTLLPSISTVAIVIFAVVRCLFELVLGRVRGGVGLLGGRFFPSSWTGSS